MSGDAPDRPLASTELSLLIRALPIAAALVDNRDVVIAWNPAAEHLFARPATTVIGRPLADVGLAGAGARSLAPQERAEHGQTWVVRTDPEGAELIASRTPVVDRAGATTGFLVCAQESRGAPIRALETENALLRQQLDATNEKLERTLEEREIAEEELRSTIQHLAEKLDELE